jgi:DNA polymerase-3 subunit chi
MPTVDFYHLSNPTTRDVFLCKLIEKVFLRKHQLYIFCATEQEVQVLDDLLWTFKDTSFIPHGRTDKTVQLGCGPIPQYHQDILINLSNTIPENYQQFKRILELSSPEHQLFYENHKLAIKHHTID